VLRGKILVEGFIAFVLLIHVLYAEIPCNDRTSVSAREGRADDT